MIGRKNLRDILERSATVVLTVGIVSLLEILVTVEWSSPLCTRAYQSWNGPVLAAFGVPLPYIRWSGASSLHYLVMVHVYLINITALSLVAYPMVRAISGHTRLASRRAAFGTIGFVLCGLVVAWRVLLVAVSIWIPVSSITFEERYLDFRPVGVAFGAHYDCTPSPLWFGAQ